LLLLSVVCAISLWIGINWFLSNADDRTFDTAVKAVHQSRDNDQSRTAGRTQAASPQRVITGTELAESGPEVNGAMLGQDEVDAREAARRQRLIEVGIISSEKQEEPAIAIDVSLNMPEKCKGSDIAKVPIGVKFRHESSLIKGESLNDLESLVALYRDCASGQFLLAHNLLGRVDATEMLTQMRLDEIKYFFIQHSVSIDAVQFPEK